MYLKLKIFEKILIAICGFIGLQFGIYGLLYSQVFVVLITFLMNAYYTDKFINFSAFEQVVNILPTLAIGLITGVCVYAIDAYFVSLLDILRIVIAGGVGLLLYVGLSFLFNIKSFFYFKNLILKEKFNS